MAAAKKYTVEGGGFAGFRLVDENGPLTGRHPSEEAAVAAYDAAVKVAAERKKAEKASDES